MSLCPSNLKFVEGRKLRFFHLKYQIFRPFRRPLHFAAGGGRTILPPQLRTWYKDFIEPLSNLSSVPTSCFLVIIGFIRVLLLYKITHVFRTSFKYLQVVLLCGNGASDQLYLNLHLL